MKIGKIPLKWIVIFSAAVFLIVYMPAGITGANDAPTKINIAVSPATGFLDLGNMKPGDRVINTITVQNKGNTDFTYSITAKHKNGSEKFYKKLLLKVYDKSGVLYNGKLSELERLKMRSLQKFSEEELTFSVSLPIETGNVYQGLSTTVALNFATGIPGSGSMGGDEETSGPQPTPGGSDSFLNAILPQTGEANPFYYYAAGLLLLITGGALYIVKRRPDR